MKASEFITEDGIITSQNTTADVKPGEIRRQAKKLGMTLGKNNRPPLLHKKAVNNSSPNTLSNLGITKTIQENKFTKQATAHSTIYLDMDGVLANFFAEYAKMANVKSYRDIPPAKGDPLLTSMQGTNFFGRLPKFPTTDALVNLAIKYAGRYSICSSPLRDDHNNSVYWKTIWIKTNLSPQPSTIEITGTKTKYAMTGNVPNILIDDKGSNIQAWIAAGGIGIKYQADEDSLDKVKTALEIIFCDVKNNCDLEDETNEMSRRDAEKMLKKNDFHIERTHGSHEVYKNDSTGETFALPHKHHTKDLSKGVEHDLRKVTQ